MANVQWTTEQQKVIDLRNRNILVSAAAGSGKTAVLVERIISMISEESSHIDIDRLLIVTFTNAAAAEMRERIGRAIEEKLKEQPDNSHLQKQMTLLHSAQITTIHSFCLHVIRNHFHVIDLDPGFRIGDEAELKLMRQDVMGAVLEEKYAQGEEAFLAFIESYSTGKTDEGIEELVLKLYDFSVSYPWPSEWLEKQKEGFFLTDKEVMERTDWMKSLMQYLKAVVHDLQEQNQQALSVCNQPDGPYPYMDALLADADIIGALVKADGYEAFGRVLGDVQWKRLSVKKDEAIADEKKELVKSIRDSIKKTIGDMLKQYYYQSFEGMFEDLEKVGEVMGALIDLTLDFAKAFAEKKEEKNVVDFNDLEHFALNILVKKEDGVETPSSVAIDLCNYYEEILIDEYQDSNLVQETLFGSIRTGGMGKTKRVPNLFMVGDVKQSIYKFRLARPELFLEKYNTYSTEDSKEQRIDLHKNFRSRAVVLEGINYVFRQIMTQALGNIEYNQEVALYPGANFPESQEQISQDTELILVEGKVELEDEDAQDYTEKELEAKSIALRIKELVNQKNGIFIHSKTGYRKAAYGDIVILLRTMTGWSDLFSEVLMAEGIPSYSDTQTGYFSALEVQTVLNLLQIIDNPRQDIPFAAVLRSPIGQLTDQELALLRAEYKDCGLYEAAKAYCAMERSVSEEHNSNLDSDVYQKLEVFFTRFETYRHMVYYTPIHSLLQFILEDTGYYHYVSVMPGGNRRSGNLDMLVQRAVNFEATSYRGLFHFNRYMEKLNKYDIDFGEAGTSNENENAVRIMSIHKSKGLEFPVVFVSGLGKVFNNQDARAKLVLHPELGVGPDYIDYQNRIKMPTLLKKAIQKQIVLENLGEELRILYVAMTRAKEKLILTGCLKNKEKQLAKWMERKEQNQEKMLFHNLAQAGNYLDWIVPAFVKHSAWEHRNEGSYSKDLEPLVQIKMISITDMVTTEVEEQVKKGLLKETLLNWDPERIYEADIQQEIQKQLSYQYPFEQESALKAKLTVTELKSLSTAPEEDSEHLFEEKDAEEAYVPSFMKTEEKISRSDRGTLYHKVMEKMNFSQIQNRGDVEKQFEYLAQASQIDQNDLIFLKAEDFLQFAQSGLAQRMEKAKQKNRLFKEQKFVFGLPANQVYQEENSTELVLVQGIMDAYFIEEDGIVLVDYKTDKVSKNQEQELAARYQIQLDYYQMALEQMTGKKVKERIIYSFALGKELEV